MVTWSQFYPYVQPEVPGAPLPLIDHMLRKAAIEFCEESAIHVIDATPIDVVANTGTYALATGNVEYDVSTIKYAWFNGVPISYVSQEFLNDQTGAYWPAQTATAPTGFTQQDQDNVILYPIPTVSLTAGLKLKLVARPSLASTGVANWIGNRFIQEIAYGGLALLAGMVGKDWTNPELEAKSRSQFEAAKTRAVIDANRSFTRAPLQIALSRKW